ncbi:MAG: sn-glycerol-3-phosphate ABC transporter ATP-binding protein UgpC [Peptococcaceae bacterium]|nr:sn-glycerol-3-phosphate ABC transporter ATP-binding protein UgpC [Peptococcaceae bacterium]
MAGVNLINVNKVFPNGVHAVKNVSLRVDEKEFMVLVGPSGCGKTTTLRMIAGLEEVSSGEVFIDDKRVNDLPAKNRDIAMVFQNYALYPHMTVFENISFVLELRKMPREEIKRCVNEAAQMLEITDLLKRKPKQLSGGQRQRVALGRAMVREPKVFLMDEPLSNLDAKLRVQMRSEISKLHRRLGTTVVYVTHDQVEAMTMGTRIAVMHGGVVHQVADPQTIYEKPVNAFVAGFIGSPAINFLRGDIVEGTNGMWLNLDNNKVNIPEGYAKVLRARGYANKAVLAGIRPENVHDDEQFMANSPHSVVETVVENTELMGPETHLYLRSVGHSPFNLVARVSPRTKARPGNNIRVALDMERIYFFDLNTEAAIY